MGRGSLLTALVERPGAIWLDTGAPEGQRAGSSYIAAEPAVWLRGRGQVLEILPGPLGDRGWVDRIASADPATGFAFDRLKAIQTRIRVPGLTELGGKGSFRGGLAGFFSYDLGREFESVPTELPTRSSDVPWEFVLGLYDEVLAVDGQTGERRVFRLPGSARRIDLHTPLLPVHLPDAPGAARAPEPEMSKEEHTSAVQAIRDHIAAGTIYQANLTLRFRAPSTHPRAPIATFLRLQRANPAPFAAFLDLPGLALVSTSPECFLALEPSGRVVSQPIKGTAPRGVDLVHDTSLREQLLRSEKDRAELTMIVDLVRNDLGRVCALGSVSRAPELRGEAHPTVWHLVADVEGQMRPGYDALDLLRASFPPGSCIGAPKIRAMAVIDELEKSRRGPYTGAIGWLGADGSLGLSVAIRTLVFREGEVSYGVGGGIVYDSDADQEWEEALLKGKALAQALGAASMPLTSRLCAGN